MSCINSTGDVATLKFVVLTTESPRKAMALPNTTNSYVPTWLPKLLGDEFLHQTLYSELTNPGRTGQSVRNRPVRVTPCILFPSFCQKMSVGLFWLTDWHDCHDCLTNMTVMTVWLSYWLSCQEFPARKKIPGRMTDLPGIFPCPGRFWWPVWSARNTRSFTDRNQTTKNLPGLVNSEYKVWCKRQRNALLYV